MYKVKITFKDGTTTEFYAEESYTDDANGLMLVWEDSNTGDLISYPTNDIKKIIESEVDK